MLEMYLFYLLLKLCDHTLLEWMHWILYSVILLLKFYIICFLYPSTSGGSKLNVVLRCFLVDKCMYVCMCVCVCMHVCMYACMYVCMHACLYVCMHVCLCMHAHSLPLWEAIHVCPFSFRGLCLLKSRRLKDGRCIQGVSGKVGALLGVNSPAQK
jgi:hypothetical protein